MLRRTSGPFGRIDFAYYPFDPLGRRTSWRGIAVESLLDRLLDLARAKFDVGAHPMGLAVRLLLVHDVRELPNMIRQVKIQELIAFFEARVQELTRKK